MKQKTENFGVVSKEITCVCNWAYKYSGIQIIRTLSYFLPSHLNILHFTVNIHKTSSCMCTLMQAFKIQKKSLCFFSSFLLFFCDFYVCKNLLVFYFGLSILKHLHCTHSCKIKAKTKKKKLKHLARNFIKKNVANMICWQYQIRKIFKPTMQLNNMLPFSFFLSISLL